MSIEVRQITKRFGNFTALDHVNLEVQSGELVALLGPSGSGKTTLLRIIAGLDFPEPGPAQVLFDGEDVTDLRASHRKAGFAFQHYALFRNLNLFENVAFGLRVRPRATRPNEVEPKVLLLDEPFGALDAKVRKELRRWLRQLHDEIHVTTLLVTHDQEEALEVADRVAILRQGKIEQVATPEEIYDRPASPFIYDFLGNVNLFHGRIHHGRIRVSRTPDERPTLPTRVLHFHAAGPMAHLELARLDDEAPFAVQLSKEEFRQLEPRPGEQLFVELQSVRVFADDYSI